MTEAEVSEGLGLDTLKGRQWAIYKSCATKGEGLETGLDWFVCYSRAQSTMLICIFYIGWYNPWERNKVKLDRRV